MGEFRFPLSRHYFCANLRLFEQGGDKPIAISIELDTFSNGIDVRVGRLHHAIDLDAPADFQTG
jgi:hypothetical protein